AMAIVLGLAWAYVRYRSTTTGGGVLYGVEPVVVAIVAVALWELGRSALKRRWFVLIGLGAVAGYFAGINVLVPLLAGGIAVSLVDNRNRITGTHALLPLAPALPTLASARVRPSTVDVLAE